MKHPSLGRCFRCHDYCHISWECFHSKQTINVELKKRSMKGSTARNECRLRHHDEVESGKPCSTRQAMVNWMHVRNTVHSLVDELKKCLIFGEVI